MGYAEEEIRSEIMEDDQFGRDTYTDITDTQFMAGDDVQQAKVNQDPDLAPFSPLYSHTLPTAIMEKDDKDKACLEVEGMFAIKEALSLDDDFSENDATKFQANAIYLKTNMSSGVKGRRFFGLMERAVSKRLEVIQQGFWDKLLGGRGS
jgi:hypothetical protein